MRQENFFTGEPVNGSPESVEASNQASFGAYFYDPSSRIQQPVGGYNNQPIYQQPIGLGYNPYMNPYQYGGYGGYNYGYGYNPYYQYQQQQFEVPKTVDIQIKPVNFSGEYLPPKGYEEIIADKQMEYWQKEQEYEAQQAVERSRAGGYYGGYYGGYNYYGQSYFFNPYSYNSLTQQAQTEVESMKEQARRNRIELNIQLSELAHNVIPNDNITSEQIRERYEGKIITVDNPDIVQTVYQGYNRLDNLVEIDTAERYRQHEVAVSREFHKIIPENSSMMEFFQNAGVLMAEWRLEEEKHRRRDDSILYRSDDNAYKIFVRKKAAERYAASKGYSEIVGANVDLPTPKTALDHFPTLKESASLSEDGTLNITCNFGNHAGENYAVHNSQEAEYEKDRERFQAFLNSIPGSIYSNGGVDDG